MAEDGGVRARLVDATVRVLAEGGPDGVQARRLTQAIGTSTTAVYHYFGGMPELLRAVADEGFRRLDQRLRAVPASADPVQDVCGLALAYVDVARANPHLYDLMFGLSAPGGHRPAGIDTGGGLLATPAARDAYANLVAASARAMAAGRLAPGDPEQVAAQLWSVLHGFISLQLAGHFGEFVPSLLHVLLPLGTNLLVGLGDSRGEAAASAQAALRELAGEEAGVE